MTARVSMLLKQRASADVIPFSLCNKKRLAIRHTNRLLFLTTLSIPSCDIGKEVRLRTYQHPPVYVVHLLVWIISRICACCQQDSTTALTTNRSMCSTRWVVGESWRLSSLELPSMSSASSLFTSHTNSTKHRTVNVYGTFTVHRHLIPSANISIA